MTRKFKGYYFKSKIMLISNDTLLLETLETNLSKQYHIVTYNDPETALEEILSRQCMDFNALTEIDNDDGEEVYYSVNFSHINQLCTNPDRVNTISVIMMDYSMFNINGISFCKRISSIPTIKILLIEPDHIQTGINALNNGIIDKLIIKDSDNFMKTVISTTEEANMDFFIKISRPIYQCLSIQANTALTKARYHTAFERILNKLNVSEYRISTSSGCYTLKTEKGIHYYFAVLLDKQLGEYLEIAEESDASYEIREQIGNRTHTPIFVTEKDYKLDVKNWPTIMHPLIREEDFYFSLIEIKQ